MKRIKFVVTLGLTDYEFECPAEAMDFAITAKQNYVANRYTTTQDVSIALVEVEENKEDK